MDGYTRVVNKDMINKIKNFIHVPPHGYNFKLLHKSYIAEMDLTAFAECAKLFRVDTNTSNGEGYVNSI
jgi:hypothetical protein